MKCVFMLFLGLTMGAPSLVARNVYVNGLDISSARHQLMENVTVRIDADGNVFIEAPHYQVNEESTFIPLRRAVSDGKPDHRPAGPLPSELSKAGTEPLESPPEAVEAAAEPPAPAAPPPANAAAPAALNEAPPGTLIGKEGSKAPGK